MFPFSPFFSNSLLQSSDSWLLSGKSSLSLRHSTLNEGIGGLRKRYISFVHDCLKIEKIQKRFTDENYLAKIFF